MSEINQCDGCQVGAPMCTATQHRMPDGGAMGCTKARYAGPSDSEMLDWLEKQGRLGFSHIAWGEYRHYAGDQFGPVRDCIRKAMKGEA